MRVLSYDPSSGFFFVDVTWDEYRRLAAQYEIDTGDSKVGAEEVIEIQKAYREEMITGVFTESYPFQQYLKDLYGIDDMPEVCLGIKKDLSYLWVDQYDYPFGHMWNGSSPWIRMEPAVIPDLSDLKALECVKRGEDGGMEKKTMYNLHWSRKDLTAQAVGTFCEYFAKMVLLSYGVDVYTPERDDHGIDFVAEGRKGFLKFQVKGIRPSSQYVFMRKEYFNVEDDAMFLILILLVDGEEPDMYIIPASAWRQESQVFVSHDYEGKKSKPEYGVNVSKKNMLELAEYRLENMLSLF